MEKYDIPNSENKIFGKSDKRYHIEVGFSQYNHEGEYICGDVFLSKRIPEEDRVLCVLSDGMGHGVRANVLATLTATISLNFTIEHKDASAIANILMKALPKSSVNGMSYATYTIVDISAADEKVSILEYDNPRTIVFKGKKEFEPEWDFVKIEDEPSDEKNFNIKECSFIPQIGDRIIFCSDGITQSGLGKGLTMGWGRNNLIEFIDKTIDNAPSISARNLAETIVKQAFANDLHFPKDDMTCGVVYFRKPRKTLLCTGPPFNPEQDHEFAMIFDQFEGRKIISGATTTEILARELQKSVTDNEIIDHSLPPSSTMEGVDLVTEGVLTLSKCIYLLNNVNNENIKFGQGPADELCKIFLNSDEIYILVGTKINETHLDPTLPIELEIRKNLIIRLSNVLSNKFLKVVTIKYM